MTTDDYKCAATSDAVVGRVCFVFKDLRGSSRTPVSCIKQIAVDYLRLLVIIQYC